MVKLISWQDDSYGKEMDRVLIKNTKLICAISEFEFLPYQWLIAHIFLEPSGFLYLFSILWLIVYRGSLLSDNKSLDNFSQRASLIKNFYKNFLISPLHRNIWTKLCDFFAPCFLCFENTYAVKKYQDHNPYWANITKTFALSDEYDFVGHWAPIWHEINNCHKKSNSFCFSTKTWYSFVCESLPMTLRFTNSSWLV